MSNLMLLETGICVAEFCNKRVLVMDSNSVAEFADRMFAFCVCVPEKTYVSQVYVVSGLHGALLWNDRGSALLSL